jgi:DHA2 family methylenomycin A resistance protein-like MFS transporter
MPSDAAQRPLAKLPLAAICLGYFMVILDATIVTVALPSLSKDLHASISGLQWVVDSYTLLFAGLLLTAGGLADRLGARGVFQAGLAIFTAASVACGAAPTTAILVGARLVQGLGAALMVPASLALLHASYADKSTRARAFGVWGGIAGVGAASGPVLGGVLSTLVTWRAVFLVNLPVGIVAMLLTRRHVIAPGAHPERGLDLRAQALGVVSLTAVTLALIEGGDAGWTSAPVIGGFVVCALAFAAFIRAERAAESPMLPPALFRARTFSGASAVGLAMNLSFYGQLFVMNLYFQQVRGYSALVTGLAILPQAVFVSLASFASGRVTARRGPRVPMTIGLLAGAAGLAALVVAGAGTSYALLLPGLIAGGFGIAFTMPAATAAIIEAAPPERSGVASGVLNASRQVGGVIGVALLGSLVGSRASFLPGLHAGLLIASGVFLAAAVVTRRTIDYGAAATASRVARSARRTAFDSART